MRDTVIVEKSRKPVVVALTQEFVELGANIARTSGHASLRQLVFPYPLEGLPVEEIRRLAHDRYPKFLAAIGARR